MSMNEKQWFRKVQWLFAEKGGIQMHCQKCKQYFSASPNDMAKPMGADIGRWNIGGNITMKCAINKCEGSALAPGGSFLLKNVYTYAGSVKMGTAVEWRRIKDKTFYFGLKCGKCGGQLSAKDGWVEICGHCETTHKEEIEKAMRGNPQ